HGRRRVQPAAARRSRGRYRARRWGGCRGAQRPGRSLLSDRWRARVERMSLFLGIDGGGTRCVALATDPAGRELARREGGPGIVRADHPEAGAATLATLAAETLRAAGSEPPAAVLCCALAGAGREPERRLLERALQGQGIATICHVTTDAEAALFDAFGRGPGLLLIS